MTTGDSEIKFDRSLLGVENDIGEYQVTKEMIIKFATSTGERNPIYYDDEAGSESEYGSVIAPPTFCNMFVSGVTRPDIKLEFGDVSLFAGQAIESVSPCARETHCPPRPSSRTFTPKRDVPARWSSRSGRPVSPTRTATPSRWCRNHS